MSRLFVEHGEAVAAGIDIKRRHLKPVVSHVIEELAFLGVLCFLSTLRTLSGEPLTILHLSTHDAIPSSGILSPIGTSC